MLRTLQIATLLLGISLAAITNDNSTAQAPQYGTGGTAELKELTLELGNKVALKVAYIPAGKFMIGSPVTEKDRNVNELQHEVTISKPFYIGVTPVTVNQFKVFATDSGYKTGAERAGESRGVQIKDGKISFSNIYDCSWRSPGFDQTGDHPVVQVDWNDAKAFCDWVSKKTGKTVVLPTEAQWEYACRAGMQTAYYWGDNPDDGKGWANCADQSLKRKLPDGSDKCQWTFFNWDDGFPFTSPVASFKANAFGLYDMTGNVSQWCQDYYGEYGKSAVRDPTGADSGAIRVLRGGAWYEGPRNCRSAYRNSEFIEGRASGIGFRVVVLY